MRIAISASIATLLVGAAAFAQSDVKVELSAVPQKVMDTAKKQVSGFTATSANTETEAGKKIYEIQGTAGGKTLEIDVAEDGTLDEVETEIQMSELPDAVTKAIMAKLPKFQATKVEESRRTSGTYYEVEGADGGKNWDVEIKADGTGLTSKELTKGS
jgi:uncharacterized membrane protein YkoI